MIIKFLDLPAALSDERFTTNDSRVKYRDALEKILSRKLAYLQCRGVGPTPSLTISNVTLMIMILTKKL